jgi:predicted MFS family arabinose efflux permease
MSAPRETAEPPAPGAAAPPPRGEAPRPGGPWAPLARPQFRALWLGALAANLGVAIQGAAASWDLTTLAAPPVVVALQQSAAALPALLVGLPAAALGDVLDRRRLLLGYSAWMAVIAAVTAALALAGAHTPVSLLALTFALGLGAALAAPIWQASLPAEAAREELGAAVTLGGVAINLARAAGPAAAGVGLAQLGSGAVYALDAALFAATAAQVHRWRPRAPAPRLPPERVLGAIVAGLRFARHAPALRAVLVRALALIAAASALWALLPLLVRHELGLGSQQFGLALGCVGAGALAGASAMPKLRARLGPDRLFAAASLVYASAMLGASIAPRALHPVALYPVMGLAGLAWIALMSGLNVAAASAAPGWVAARALGLYLLVLQGGTAAGALLWGAVAEATGVPAALQLAAAAAALSVLAGLRYRLGAARASEVATWQAWPEPPAATGLSLAGDAGPVWILRAYRAPAARAAELLALAPQLERLRRRDGAIAWALAQDAADPERFVELFEVASWLEHLRQHGRAVAGDAPLVAQLATFGGGGDGDAAEPVMHLIDAAAAARARARGIQLASDPGAEAEPP